MSSKKYDLSMPAQDYEPPLPKALRKGATRAAFIAAAHTIAARGGDADPLDPAAVTSEAGTSRPLFYAHFPTRGDFIDAVLASIHEDQPRPAEGAGSASVGPREAVLAFFARLAAPLDRHAALAPRADPASHLPGPVAEARSRRRAGAVAHLAEMLPASLPEREARAAFLMDAFLGLQLAWSKALVPGALADRVRRELAWAIDGVLAAGPGPLPAPPPAPIPESATSLLPRPEAP